MGDVDIQLAVGVSHFATFSARDAHRHWLLIRESGLLPLISDVVLSSTAAQIGDLEILRDILSRRQTDFEGTAIGKSAQANLELIEGRRQQLPEKLEECHVSRQIGRQLISARRFNDAERFWEMLASQETDLEPAERLIDIARWYGDWGQLVARGQALAQLKPRKILSEHISRAQKLIQRADDPIAIQLSRFRKYEGFASVRESASPGVLRELNEDLAFLEAHLAAEKLPSAQVKVPHRAAEVLIPPRLRSTGLEHIFFQCKDYSKVISRGFREPDQFEISLEQDAGWLRIFVGLMDIGEADRIICELPLSMPGAPVVKTSLAIIVDDNLVSQEVACEVTCISEGEYVAAANIDAAQLQAKRSLDCDHGPFVMYTVSQPQSLAVKGALVRQVRFDEIPAPFRYSEHQTHRALKALNDRLYRATRDGLREWLLTEARLALRVDCIETASGILGLLRSSFDQDVLEGDVAYHRLAVDVAFAEGTAGSVLPALIRNYRLVADDEGLSNAMRQMVSADPSLGSFSQKASSAFELSKKSTAEILASAAACPEPFLLCNAALGVSEAAYIDCVNHHLEARGLNPFRLAVGDGPILKRISQLPNRLNAREDCPLVTIGVAAYNASDTIEYAVKSLIDQDYPNLEVIVVDDSSSDNTWDILLSLGPSDRLRLMRSRENQGPYNIRNLILSEAKGDVIGFHDADDLSHINRVSLQMECLSHPGTETAICNGVRLHADGRFVFFRDNHCERQSTISLLARRHVFDRVGRYRSAICGADSDYLERIRLARGQSSIKTVPLPLVFSLWGEGSLTKQEELRASEDSFKSPSRRMFAEASARERLLGAKILKPGEVDVVLKETGLWREARGLVGEHYGDQQ